MSELNYENQEYYRIIDFLPIAVCVLDRRGIVINTNKKFKTLFGKNFTKDKECGPGDLISCVNSYLNEKGCGNSEYCERCLLRQSINRVLEGGLDTENIEVPLVIKADNEQEKRWFEIQISTEILENDNFLILSFSDITLYKKKSLKLLQNKRLAEETNKAKSEFLANMSHEIRTPLNGMIGMLELTMQTELSEEQRENLEIAKNCADTLLSLINDILDISKVERNKFVLENTTFDIRELVKKIADTHMAKVAEKNLEFECYVEDSVPVFVYGDSFRLQQVLNNLVSNAIKFTFKGKVRLEIKTLCKAADSYTLAFAVEDTGIGIAQKDMKHLFKMFSQVDGSYTRRYGGSGLGLVISQRLVNLMGGEIKVKSGKDKGSVFFFTVQMKVGEKQNVQKPVAACEMNGERSENILVVEDDKANQLVIKKILHKLGYHSIEMAGNGYEAVHLQEQKEYDIILMDIQLPELNGIEATQIIRELEKKSGKHVPIIAMTAHVLKGDKEKFLSKGMDNYVPKPIDFALLKNVLEQYPREKEEWKKEINLKEAYKLWNKNSGREERGFSQSDKKIFQELLDKIEYEISGSPENLGNWEKIEGKAHELKVTALKKDCEQIRKRAFRIELAARKKDINTMINFCREIQTIINLAGEEEKKQ